MRRRRAPISRAERQGDGEGELVEQLVAARGVEAPRTGRGHGAGLGEVESSAMTRSLAAGQRGDAQRQGRGRVERWTGDGVGERGSASESVALKRAVARLTLGVDAGVGSS